MSELEWACEWVSGGAVRMCNLHVNYITGATRKRFADSLLNVTVCSVACMLCVFRVRCLCFIRVRAEDVRSERQPQPQQQSVQGKTTQTSRYTASTICRTTPHAVRSPHAGPLIRWIVLGVQFAGQHRTVHVPDLFKRLGLNWKDLSYKDTQYCKIWMMQFRKSSMMRFTMRELTFDK